MYPTVRKTLQGQEYPSYPNNVLQKTNQPVEKVSIRLISNLDDMVLKSLRNSTYRMLPIVGNCWLTGARSKQIGIWKWWNVILACVVSALCLADGWRSAHLVGCLVTDA